MLVAQLLSDISTVLTESVRSKLAAARHTGVIVMGPPLFSIPLQEIHGKILESLEYLTSIGFDVPINPKLLLSLVWPL